MKTGTLSTRVRQIIVWVGRTHRAIIDSCFVIDQQIASASRQHMHRV